MKSFLLVLSSFLLFFGCSKKGPVAEKRPTVVVSVPPYVYFVERIAGQDINAIPLIPPGSNPHLFEPSPKEVEEVRTAALWVRLHESFENKIATALQEQNKNLIVIDLCAHHSEEEDHHLWLSLKKAQEQAEAIASGLIRLYPEKESLYRANLDSFIEELQQLDAEIAQTLEPFKGEVILTSHPAFGYFCEDYGLMQLSIECEGKDPLPQDLADTLEFAKNYTVRSVLLQPQYNNKGAELIAGHLSLPTHSIDPYTSDYIQNLKELVHLIAQTSHRD